MDLFTPLKLGALELRNRVVMAPMTRSRAGEDGSAHRHYGGLLQPACYRRTDHF